MLKAKRSQIMMQKYGKKSFIALRYITGWGYNEMTVNS